MGTFQPLPQHQRRQRFPFALALISIAVATACLEAQTQFAFASHLYPMGGDIKTSLDRAQQPFLPAARLAGGFPVHCQGQFGTSYAAATSFWSFYPGRMLVLCAVTASISLARKQRCSWRGAKAHCITARCTLTGFDTGLVLGSQPLPACCTHGSVLAATDLSAVMVEALKQQPALPESGLILPSKPPVTDSKDLVRRGLSNVSPAFRVNTVRYPCPHGGIGRKASASGRTRSARRAVGAWLQATHKTPITTQQAWDPSRLRMQLQVGLQVLAQRNKSGQPHSFNQLSIKCISLVDHSRGIPVSIMNKS